MPTYAASPSFGARMPTPLLAPGVSWNSNRNWKSEYSFAGVEVGAVAGLRVEHDGAVLHLVARAVADPALEVAPVEERHEALRLLLVGERLGCTGAQLAHVDVAERQVGAVRLQLDRAAREDRLLPIPVVLHRHVVHDLDAVEEHGDLVADHADAERVPLAHRVVGEHQRLARVLLVVVEPARPDLGARRRCAPGPRSAPAACRAGRCRCRRPW